MKQLLAWTARRVMDREKATSTRQPVEANAAAIGTKAYVRPQANRMLLTARVIEEDVLKDLSENQVPLSWYSRTEDVVPVGKKKHPQNLANLAKIQECNEILEKWGFRKGVIVLTTVDFGVKRTRGIRCYAAGPWLMQETKPRARARRCRRWTPSSAPSRASCSLL